MKHLLILLILSLCVYSSFSQPGKKPKHRTPPATLQHGLGAVFVAAASYNSMPHLALEAISEPIRKRLSTLNIKHEVPAPPVGDQKQMGSCVGWSVGYTFLSSYLQRHQPQPINWSGANETSPSFVYHFAKVNNDCLTSGCYLHVGFECIRDNGSCLLQSWPYSENDCNLLPSAQQLFEACTYSSPWKFGRAPACPEPAQPIGGLAAIPKDGPVLWQAVNPTDVSTIKGALMQYNWPVVIAFNVSNSFVDMWYNGGIWTRNDATNQGGHSVCIIGFDDNKIYNGVKGMFKCQNQWGAQEGDHGYFWVSYDLVRASCLREVYVWVRDEPAWNGCPTTCPD